MLLGSRRGDEAEEEVGPEEVGRLPEAREKWFCFGPLREQVGVPRSRKEWALPTSAPSPVVPHYNEEKIVLAGEEVKVDVLESDS